MKCSTPFESIWNLGNCPQCGGSSAAHALADIASLKRLLVEADSYISHMVYRGSWPDERNDVERLIGRLRSASR